MIVMKTYIICPVSDKSINERVARLNAFFTFLTILFFAITQNILLIVFLGIDFYLRAWDLAKFSPLAMVSKNLVKFLGLVSISINAGPKIFAARIGMLFSVLIAFLFVFKLHVLAFGLATILGLFSFLEFAFGICVACVLYPYVNSLVNRK
jgi:hypothetical protein